jgi:hypothetical protein
MGQFTVQFLNTSEWQICILVKEAEGQIAQEKNSGEKRSSGEKHLKINV